MVEMDLTTRNAMMESLYKVQELLAKGHTNEASALLSVVIAREDLRHAEIWAATVDFDALHANTVF